MLKSKTFAVGDAGRLDEKFDEWSKENPNIKVISSHYTMTTEYTHGLNVIYDDDPKPESTDESPYKDNFLFRLLMACYGANTTSDENATKINPEDMEKLKWHISRQCPNFNKDHHTCNTARCDKECSYFSSYIHNMLEGAVMIKGGSSDATK